MVAIITASVCYLEPCLVPADSSSCLLQLLQVLLPHSIAGPGLSCVMHYGLIMHVVSDAHSDVQVPAPSYQSCL